MKKMRFFTCGLLLLSVASWSISSCHKSSGASVGPVSLNVINAMPTSQPIIPVLSVANLSQWFANASPIGFGNSSLYSPLSGSDTMLVAQQTDTAGPKPIWLFGGVLHLSAGGIYSFFLSGDSTKTDTMLVVDNIPYYTDSSAGVRFVNLMPASQPITINITGNTASQVEFGPLGYRTISAFKKYLANSTVQGSSYSFDIRDQASGNVLTTFTWSYTFGKNNTLVVYGSEDPTSPLGAPQVFQTNNF